MYKLLVLLTVLLFSLGTQADEKADSLFVTKALADAPATAGTLYFARLFLGRPYVAHTLEVNDREQLVVNTRQLDCTTLVENVVALTICLQRKQTAFADFKSNLQQLRYRQGRLDGYASRLHYFSDWIDDNADMGLVKEVQSAKAPFTAVQTLKLNFMSQHPQAYKALKAHPELVPVIAQQEKKLTGRQYRFIPRSQVAAQEGLHQAVHDGDIIAITCSKPGLDIAHLGFAVWWKDGLHLLNASQLHKKVVEEPTTLSEYLSKHSSFTGIRVIKVL